MSVTTLESVLGWPNGSGGSLQSCSIWVQLPSPAFGHKPPAFGANLTCVFWKASLYPFRKWIRNLLRLIGLPLARCLQLCKGNLRLQKLPTGYRLEYSWCSCALRDALRKEYLWFCGIPWLLSSVGRCGMQSEAILGSSFLAAFFALSSITGSVAPEWIAPEYAVFHCAALPLT